MHRIIFDEIVNLPKNISLEPEESMRIVQKYSDVEIAMDDNYNLFYTTNLNELLSSDIDNDTMIQIVVDGGWIVSQDGEDLIKYVE